MNSSTDPDSARRHEFLAALEPHMKGVKAMIAIRMQGTGYADDVLQETLLAAWRHQTDVRDPGKLRAWLFQIARNQCSDVYRRTGREVTLGDDAVTAGLNHHGRGSRGELASILRDAVAGLPLLQREAIAGHYLLGYSVREMAARLAVPEGTVKRRMFDGRKRLRALLCHIQPHRKGSDTMNMNPLFPMIRPDIVVTPSDEPPFEVTCPESLWMYESVNVGDTLWFGLYDPPDWRMTSLSRARTAGKARIHGIEGAEVHFTGWDGEDGGWKESRRKVYLATLDGEVKTLAASWDEGGIPCFSSYLDPGFDDNWNGRVSMNLRDEGRFEQTGPGRYRTVRPGVSPGAGRVTVAVGGRCFDCLRVLDAQDGALLEGFLLENGHVLLGRRYNHRGWKIGEGTKYGPIPWDERFPDYARIAIDGVDYIHWYDTVSDSAFR